MGQVLNIGIIGDYQPGLRYHPITQEALNHAASALSIPMTLSWVSTRSLETGTQAALGEFNGLWAAPGDYQSMKGALSAIEYAREQEIPFIGT